MIKIDLHTHSIYSPDGGIHAKSYDYFLRHKLLDVVAVTDHNGITYAQELQAVHGQEKIIVGQEIMTTEGEIVGLYLQHEIAAGLSAKQAVAEIKKQKGLVYIPHPFETVRSGISHAVLDSIAPDVDIIEGRNGRALFQNRGRHAWAWARERKVAVAASSDAHGRFGWGYTYSMLSEVPAKESLVKLLKQATYRRGTVGVGVLYPKLNRLRKRVRRAA